MGPTPLSTGFFMPAEWEPHQAVWLAWPTDPELWEADLEPAREEFVALCRAIATTRSGAAEAERLLVLVRDERGEREAGARLAGLGARIHRVAFGDIWLRDTGPVFLVDDAREVAAVCFHFNGWGGKYRFPGDDALAGRIAELAGVRSFVAPFVLEGGAVEVDGEGTCIATRECVLNANRNPTMSTRQIELAVCDALGVTKVVWLRKGLARDHTDGHVDTLARFAGPGHVLCMEACAAGDPNRDVLEAVARDLRAATDARGRRLDVTRLPSPGAVLDHEGQPLPASYLNYYLANDAVVVPVYGSKYDGRAVDVIARCFPDRVAVGLPARHILTGGGAFHCITQQQPAGRGSQHA